MATGDPVATNRVSAVYEDDHGEQFCRAVPAFYRGQAGLGWVITSDASLEPLRRGIKPRAVLAHDAAAPTHRRRIIVATAAAYAAIVVGTTTFLTEWNGAEATFTVYAKEGERRRGKVLDIV